MSRTVYLNGAFVPEAEAKLSIYDLSVMQAAAAFEMTRSFNGRHFKLVEHLRRLEQSCRLLHLPFPVTLCDLEDLCYAVSERNPHGRGEEHRLLIVVSPGCAGIYRELDGVIAHPYVYIADFPLRYTVAGMSRYWSDGVNLTVSPIRQIASQSIPARAKHRARLHFHLAQTMADPEWALMLTQDDMVAECPGANVCALFEKRLVCATHEALPGISQRVVAELADRLDLEVEWGDLSITDLWNAREVWLTGTPFCLLPVVSLDGRPIGAGTWPVAREITAAWNEMVGVNIPEQLAVWDSAGSRN